MVGTRTSNRCETCRRRKVKCDEAWPVCGPCGKGRRTCPGPPTKDVRWVKTSDNSDSATNNLDESQPGFPNERKNTHMVTLRSTRLRNGVQMQKFRLVHLPASDQAVNHIVRHASPLVRGPYISPSDALSRRVYATTDPTTNSKILSISYLMRELVGRFGNSAALDNATLCLVGAHESIARGDHVSKWCNAQQYGKALRSVQKAVNDPTEQYSTNTLAAIAVMWRLENITSRGRGVNAELVHSKALAYMLQHRGIRSPHDPLELLLVVECILGNVQAAMGVPQSSEFDTPEWEAAISSLKGPSLVHDLNLRVFYEWVKWPGFLRDIVALQLVPGEASYTIEQVLHRVIAAAKRLEHLSHSISNVLLNPSICLTVPSTTNDVLVAQVYYFKIPFIAAIVSYHSFYNMSVHRMIVFLNSILPATSFDLSASPTFYPSAPPGRSSKSLFPADSCTLPLSEMHIARLHLANLELSKRVWMMYEHVRQWKPIGSLFLNNALKATYPCAGSVKMRQWIIKAGLDIDDFVPNERDWQPARIEWWCQFLSGDLRGARLEKSAHSVVEVAEQIRTQFDFQHAKPISLDTTESQA